MKYSEIDVPQTITAIGVVITALTGLVTAVGIAINTYLTKKASKKAEAAVRENHTELVEIHRLVNGSHLAVLKSNAANARRVAMMTGSEGDLAAARDAERLLEEHMIAEAKAAQAKEALQQGVEEAPQI